MKPDFQFFEPKIFLLQVKVQKNQYFATFEGEVFVAKELRVWHVQDSYSTAGTLSIDESELL